MKYEKTITLKDGTPCTLRTAGKADGPEVLEVFLRCHSETDYLLTYPDEKAVTVEEEGEYLDKLEKHDRKTELCAVVGGKIVGTAGIELIQDREKVRHRCTLGISVLREYWGRGIGRALMEGCIDCARRAGYEQMELEVAAGNDKAERLYKSLGFTEYGRNPLGFKSRKGYQELVLMRLDLRDREKEV